MNWLEAAGWIGSILVVVSLTQARVLRFRWLNLVGSVVATVYNTILGIWPFVAMNGAIVVINLFWLTRLYRSRHSTSTYETVAAAASDQYVQHLMRANQADLARTAPGFEATSLPDNCLVYLVVRGNETVGVVCLEVAGPPGQATVILDWVSPRFRDFTPGEFVYRQSGVFAAHGLTHLQVLDPPDGQLAYLRRMGFQPAEVGWQLVV